MRQLICETFYSNLKVSLTGSNFIQLQRENTTFPNMQNIKDPSWHKKMFSIEIMLSIRKLFRTFSSQLIAKQGCSASNNFCRQRKFTTIFITKWLVKSFYNSFLEMLELTSVRTFRYWSFLFWMILWWSHISFSNVLIKSFNILISFASLKFTPPSASCLYSLNSASSSSFSFNSRS